MGLDAATTPVDLAVCGSINVDLVGDCERLPGPGETVLGGALRQSAGGKGANQAVAAARFGARVAMWGAVGDDPWGSMMLSALEADGVAVDRVARLESEATGTALIAVDAQGENQIVVLPGANDHAPTPQPCGAKVWLCQAELPPRTMAEVLAAARSDAALAMCNPSPVASVEAELLRRFDLVVVNEIEQHQLADALPERVVVTLGARGALLLPEGTLIPGLPMSAVDTTGAGDAFAGVLAAALAHGLALPEAARFANIAAGLSVRTPGAQPSYATRAEILSDSEEVRAVHD